MTTYMDMDVQLIRIANLVPKQKGHRFAYIS